jgi:hypothetical protein
MSTPTHDIFGNCVLSALSHRLFGFSPASPGSQDDKAKNAKMARRIRLIFMLLSC